MGICWSVLFYFLLSFIKTKKYLDESRDIFESNIEQKCMFISQCSK